MIQTKNSYLQIPSGNVSTINVSFESCTESVEKQTEHKEKIQNSNLHDCLSDCSLSSCDENSINILLPTNEARTVDVAKEISEIEVSVWFFIVIINNE